MASGAVGIFFTWLVGAQSRKHLEVMTSRTEERADRERLVRERRDAYLAALQILRIGVRRRVYLRNGAIEKLQEVDRIWPKGERVRMTIDAFVRVDAFGSFEAQRLAARWLQVADTLNEESMNEADMRSLYAQAVDLARRELGSGSMPDDLANFVIDPATP
jgi:hypothetical protein